jgi:hypothetical protein
MTTLLFGFGKLVPTQPLYFVCPLLLIPPIPSDQYLLPALSSCQFLRQEKLKWFQRAKTTKILQGDDNTKFFHLVANGKR